ncbi:MAG: hypothetical protein ACXW0T_06065, partial [Methylobacter sp.]
MSNYERDPREVAARYRVKKDEEGKFELCSEQGSPVNLTRDGAFLYFQTILNAVKWHARKGEEAFYVINLLVAELDIGNSGNEGCSHSNALVDNCFFVIDGETLRYLPFTQIRVLSEEQFTVSKLWLAAEKGETPTPKTKGGDDSAPSLGRATITHCDAMPEHGVDESLECTIGLPQAHFQQLLDGCLSERVSEAYFRGIGGALSSGSQYPDGAVRDLILLAGEGF